jgi:orotidine-5'-phosphate decarboxylase
MIFVNFISIRFSLDNTATVKLFSESEIKLARALSKVFVDRARSIADKTGSRIILAYDPTSNPYRLKSPEERLRERLSIQERAKSLLLDLDGLIVGAKIGLPAILALGPDKIEELIGPFKKSYLFICDSKMADIGHVNRLVAEQIFDIGFDALIIHAAIGVKGGMDEVVKLANERDRGVLGLCSMSHPGAEEHLNRHIDALLNIASTAGVDGYILPATFPHLIRKARELNPDALILSPGVGVQGAPFGSALSAGADFEIVGRAISVAPSPKEAAEKILEEMKG